MLVRIALPAATLLLLTASCSDPDAGGPGGGTDAGTGGGCEAPREMCGSVCVNTDSDPDHCGGCSQVCGAGAYCSDGECATTCGAGLTECGASCADLSTDPDHCGDCGNECAAGEVCEAGSCGCPGGRRACDGTCVDVETNPDHCGLCGRACESGETCEAGSCTGGTLDAGTKDAGTKDGGTDAGSEGCASGTHRCGDACVDDMANDPANGCRLGCGDACPEPDMSNATCTTEGTCDFECIAPATRVGDRCESGVSCDPDLAEDNDTQATAYALADFTDSPDTSMTFASFNIDADGDTDWYRFAVSDDGLDGNPIVEVALDRVPAGSDYDLGVWFRCDSGTTEVTCTSGSPNDLDATSPGCISNDAGSADELVAFSTSCSGTTDESGIVLVRVLPYTWDATCDDYRLVINVH